MFGCTVVLHQPDDSILWELMNPVDIIKITGFVEDKWGLSNGRRFVIH